MTVGRGGTDVDGSALARHIAHAERELRDAIAALHPILPHATAQQQVNACLAHRKAGSPNVASDPGHRGLCRWCYDFQRAHGQHPPPELVNRHDAGYALGNPTTVANALKKPARKAPPKSGWAATPAKRPPTRRTRMMQRVAEAAARIGGW